MSTTATQSTVTASQFDDLMNRVDKLSSLVDEVHQAVISPQHGSIFFQLNEIRDSIQAIERKMPAQGTSGAAD